MSPLRLTQVTDDGKLLLVAGVMGLVIWLVMTLGQRLILSVQLQYPAAMLRLLRRRGRRRRLPETQLVADSWFYVLVPTKPDY